MLELRWKGGEEEGKRRRGEWGSLQEVEWEMCVVWADEVDGT